MTGTGAGTAVRSVLKITDLVAGYGGGDVLRGVSLEVTSGGVTCVVGPNGAGKSTLLASISALLRPRLGSIELDGRNLVGLSPRQVLRLGVVQVPQNHSLFRDMTVRENIELGGYILSDRALTARRMTAVFDLFPDIAGWAGKKAGSLSGGQQRLVEFARALMLEPRLLLLDEPSMGLAPKILRTVFGAIRQMNSAGTTILLVEQNARAGLRLSSHGVVMESGRVRLSGTGREVLENPEIGALYLGGAVRPVVVALVDHPAVRERVVHHDQPAGPHPRHDLAPVAEVAALVGVDERQVELLLAGQRAQRVDGRAEPQLDTVGEAGLLPVLPGHRGPFLADVAAQQAPARGQPAGDADGGVAGEGADLDRRDGPGQLGQQRHEGALLGRDGQAHLGREQLHRLVGQFPQDRVRRAAVRGEVRVEVKADLLGTLRHGTTL
jgi:branched-chain amino acid transport system ATP-binding protein